VLRISRLRSNLRLQESSSDQLFIIDGADANVDILVESFGADRDVRIEGGEIGSATLSNINAGEIALRGIVANTPKVGVTIENATVAHNISADTLSSSMGSALAVKDSRIGGSLMVGRLEVPTDVATCALVSDCSINGHLAISEQAGTALAASLIRTHILGKLRIDGLDAHISQGGNALLYVDDSTVTSMNLPIARYRGKNAIRDLCAAIFTEVNLDSLAILRTSFATQHRALSEDAAYALLQDLMSREERFGYFKRILFGNILGWGVELWPPVRAMALLIALTIPMVFLMIDAEPLLYHLAASIIEATGLWINVDTTTDTYTSHSALYGTLELACATLGILFTTIIVGVAIRKLVR
jgi:hypothetical protein